ncbi:MAG: PKD domain-containing protein [Bacteroidia bacterium]
MKRILLLSTLAFAFFTLNDVKAQCDPTVPSYVVDLTGAPNSTYISPNTGRAGICCTTADNCVEFIITLHPDAVGVIFDIYSGAVPPGALFYQIGCGPETQVGTGICLTSVGPHYLTFCKPGGNTNEFVITSISEPSVSGSITLNEGCSGQITTSGYDPASITWNSIYPSTLGAYNGFLSCTSGCDIVNVQSTGTFPAYVDYQVCGNPVGGCNTIVYCDTVRVFFNATLAVSLVANPPIICYGSSGTNITATISGGSSPYNVSWSTGATVNNTNSSTHSITVNSGGTYTVTITDASGCPGVSSSITITQNTMPPTVNAGADQKVCADDFPVQLNGTISGVDGILWSGGSGSFSNVNALNPTYTPSATDLSNGFVILTAEGYFNAVCTSVYDQVTIYLAPNTISTTMVSSPATLCWGATSVTIDANISGGVTPYQSVVWNDGVVGNPRTATVGGTYTITIVDDYGCSHSNSITINQITQQPMVNAGTDRTLCMDVSAGGSASISLNATYNNLDGIIWSGGGGTFSNINSPTSTYTPTTTEINNGTVTLTIEGYYSGGICPSVYDQVTFTLYEFSNQTTVTNTNLTCFRSDDGTAMVNFGSDGPHTISWISNGGSTANPLTNLAAGTYTVRVTNAGGCYKLLNTTITQPDDLILTANKQNETCFESDNGRIELNSVGGNKTHNYFIDGVACGKTIQNLQAANYTLEVIDERGCRDDLVETITEPFALDLAITVSNVRCYGEIGGSIQAVASGGTAPYYSNSLSYTGSYTSLNNLIAGTYAIDVYDANGCAYAQQVTVTQPNQLLANFTVAKDTFCAGEVVSVNSSVSGGTPNYQYNWSNPLISGSFGNFYAQQTENITLTVTDANGCQYVYTDGFYVPTLNPADFQFSLSDNEICFGESINVTALYNGDNYPLTVSWNNTFSGLGTHTDSPSSNTIYQVYVADKCNNQFVDNRNLTVRPLPGINLPTIVEEGCSPLTVDFSKYPQSSDISSYFWEFGNGTISNEDEPYVTFYDAGQFNIKLSVEDIYGCANSKTSESAITVFPSPHSSPSAERLIVDEYSPIVQFYNKSYDHDRYTWDFGDGYYSSVETEPVHKYKTVGTYTVELAVENDYGCIDKEYLIVEVQPVANIFIPSAFTPNNDNLNENFKIVSYNIQEEGFIMEIFTRWGEKIFQTQNLNEGWDGTYKGTLVTQGNYVYKVIAIDLLGNKQELFGSVAVIR